ncbi:MAG: hypothetical protein P8103_06785 [Candidatus Thiodiazotropha sp.]
MDNGLQLIQVSMCGIQAAQEKWRIGNPFDETSLTLRLLYDSLRSGTRAS